TPPALAVALTGRHADWSIHIHVVRFTTCSPLSGGLRCTSGSGIGVRSDACCASAAGSTARVGSHTMVAVDCPFTSVQTLRYQVPDPVPVGSPNPLCAIE